MTMQTSQMKLQMLHFLVQNVHLCFEIHYITKILPLVELKPVPGSPAFIAGLINISGKSILVIDLAIRLGLKRSEKYTLSTPIVICNDDSREIGIIVDEVLGLTVADSNTLQMKNNFSDPESLFIGVITLDSKLALVLNMHKILSVDLSTQSEPSSNEMNSINLSEFKYE
jgi:purine-binding chemotaxis protein CheW